MKIYDEKIKKANREIEKLLTDIEKKKARIEELRNLKKQCETAKTRDAAFSDSFLNLLIENGINSDEQRKAVLAHIEDFIIAQEIESSEEVTEETTSAPAEVNVSSIQTNSSPAAALTNISFPYKPTTD